MANWVRDTPWRQGHALSDETVKALGLSASEESECLALVISHDCDLAASPEQEPFVEIIAGRRIAAEDGNNTYAKNARKLHLTFNQGENTVFGEFLAASKATVSKSDLAAFEPRSDLSLTAETKSILQRWLAARYRRSAFADEFVKRLDDAGLGDRLARIVKPSGAHLRGIFFDVDGGEEITRDGPGDLYVLDIILVHTTEDPDAAFRVASDAATQIEAAFQRKLYRQGKGWEFIELRDCIAMSDEAITVKQSSQYKEWRLEHLSLRERPAQAMIEH